MNQLRSHEFSYDPQIEDGQGGVHSWTLTARLEYEGTRAELEHIVRSLIRASEPTDGLTTIERARP